jgi:hypothetical protein
MRDEWAEAFGERARAYWTAERTAELVRGKRLVVLPAEAPELLRALGILNRDATMPPAARRKFFQINHMVGMLRPSLRELAAARAGAAERAPVRIVDAACGRSYLTLLVAWTLANKHGLPVEVLGVDRNADVIGESERRTAAAGLSGSVRHLASPLSSLDVRASFDAAFPASRGAPIDALIALHACDTATDDALVLGVELEAALIAAAPCCQAELAARWAALAGAAEAGEAGDPGSPDAFAPVRRTPHLRREVAALVTDTMRQLLLRAAGYETWALEMVPTEHTPKNLLLRAMNRRAPDAAARAEYEALRAATGGVGIGLAERLRPRS